MEMPSASRQLPKGFENLPVETLENILLRLNWRDLHRACQAYPRVAQICEDILWPRLQKLHFPKSNLDTGFYQSSFHNYLATSVRQDYEEIRNLLRGREYAPEVQKEKVLEIKAEAEAKSQILQEYLTETYPDYYLFEDLETDNIKTFLEYYNELGPSIEISELQKIRKLPNIQLPDGASQTAIYYYPLWYRLANQPGKLIRLSDPDVKYYFLAWKSLQRPISITMDSKDYISAYILRLPTKIPVIQGLLNLIYQAGLTTTAATKLFNLPEDSCFDTNGVWF
jgi:hypothetical protein